MHWGDNDDGGFMNTSVAEEPTKLTDTVGVGGEDKNKSIAAVSVCLVSKFTRPSEGLVLHNKKVYHLSLVAFVREIIDANSNKIHVLVDDYTAGGPLEVNHIIGDTGPPGEDNPMFSNQNQISMDQDDRPKSLQMISVGDYVKCIGVVKFNQDKPNFVAYNMRFVEDPNEVTTHTLEVIHNFMFYERQSKGTPLPSANGIGLQQTTNNGSGFNGMNGGGSGGEMNTGNLLSNRDKHILKFLKDKKAVNMNFDEICNNFKAFSKEDVQAALESLSAEGLAWPGDSEQQWCVNS